MGLPWVLRMGNWISPWTPEGSLWLKPGLNVAEFAFQQQQHILSLDRNCFWKTKISLSLTRCRHLALKPRSIWGNEMEPASGLPWSILLTSHWQPERGQRSCCRRQECRTETRRAGYVHMLAPSPAAFATHIWVQQLLSRKAPPTNIQSY